VSTLLPRDGVTFCTNEEGTVLLDTNRGRFYGLNPAAAVAWTVLAGGRDAEDAVQAVLACFDIDQSAARRDVNDLLAVLTEHGLLECSP
jgi:hypothetical protein